MPPLTLRHLVATALLGDRESDESVALPDIYSSGGSRNLSIDKNGRVAQILGYSRQTPNPILSNAGALAMRLRGLFHYVSQTGGAVTRKEIGIFTDDFSVWEFRTSIDAGVSWTFVYDYGVGSVNKIPSFAASGNLLFLTNGVIPPAQYDGAALTVAGGVQLAAPTYTKVGAGTLSGNVGWRILPMQGNVRKLSSVQSINYVLNLETGHVDWAADPDGTVTGYEIYRTTGSGALLYLEGTVVGRLTVTFTVGSATDLDTSIIANRVLQEFGDPPPVGVYFCEPHQERMWYVRTDLFPRRAWFSDPGLPFSCNLAFSYIDFTDAESFSDFATGGIGDFLGLFVLFQERSIWVVSGTGQVVGTVRDYNRRRTSASMGAVSDRCITRIPSGAVYVDSDGNTKHTSSVTLAYLTPQFDIRLFDGDKDEIISQPKRTTLRTGNYAARSKAWCEHDHFRQEVTWVFPTGAASEPTLGVTWNYQWGTWYTRDWPFAHGVEIETPNSPSFLLAGEALITKGALCYQLWNGYTFDGGAINSQWMTKTIYGRGFFGDPTGLYGQPIIGMRKRWRFANVMFDVQVGNVTLTVEWLVGDDPADGTVGLASKVVSFTSSILETSDNSIIETSDNQMIGTIQAPATLRAKFQDAKGKYAHGRGIRLRIKGSTSSGQWFCDAIDIVYQLLVGDRRTVGSIP